MIETSLKKRYQILFVEDDKHVRQTISEFLRENHFHVIEAQDGESALQMSRNQRFNLILCDLKLPRMSGDALIVEIRKNPLHENTPIFVLSGNLCPDIIKKIQGVVQKIMVKPVPLPSLVKEIMQVHKKKCA